MRRRLIRPTTIRPLLQALAASCTIALAPVTSGCAGMIAESVVIEEATTSYVFAVEGDRVLSAAQAELFERGYVVSTTSPYALETEWLFDDDGDRRSRHLVQISSSPQGTRLRAMQASQVLGSNGWMGGTPYRDPHFELEVIERIDPDHATRIRAEAAAARAAARSSGGDALGHSDGGPST